MWYHCIQYVHVVHLQLSSNTFSKLGYLKYVNHYRVITTASDVDRSKESYMHRFIWQNPY